MIVWLFVIAFSMNGDDPSLNATGTIEGVVVNGSLAGGPLADVEVHLRAGAAGALEPVASTTTDLNGNFSFCDLPLDPTIVYLPGANRDGVHYPGQRVRLDPAHGVARVKITAFDAEQKMSPLVATHHDIDIRVKERVMEVTETLIVSNPTRTTYVGHSQGERGPVTLRVTVPPSFDRVTFSREFFGRRFQIIDQRLVTDIPWTPGDKELQFAYRVPLDGPAAGQFRRPLDLPSAQVRVCVHATDPQQVSCNLSPPTGVGGDAIVTSAGDPLPAGYIIELTIGRIPLPWMLYARWGSMVALIMLVLGTLSLRRYRRQMSLQQRLSTSVLQSRSPDKRRAVCRRAA
jgi:hypothetical protein